MNESITITTVTPELHPDWCSRKDDCYDQIPDAATHSSTMVKRGQAQAEIEQVVDWVGGYNVHRPLHVLAWMYGEQVGGDMHASMTASDCRDLAAVLLANADKLDELAAVDNVEASPA